MILVLDESSSIGGTQFTELLKFVIKIVNDIDVGDNRTRVGVMTFSSEPRVIYELSQSQSKDAVRDVIMCRVSCCLVRGNFNWDCKR